MSLRRRTFLASAAAAGTAWAQAHCFASALTLPFRPKTGSADELELQWADVRDWGVEGRGFNDTEAWFDRLPGRAKGVVRDAVWGLSRHSAGMLVHFRTDATRIDVNYAVTSENLAMPHMPATGVSGLDLYGRDESGQWKWVAVVAPKTREVRQKFVDGLLPGERDYAIYLPLYNGTQSLQIGVPTGTKFQPIPPRTEKPIVFYGTSITHGACASRPGMPHPAILWRRLNRPVINLGFSGNGRMELEVGRFLAEIDSAVFVIDCLPNITSAEVTARTQPLVKLLREARPQTPIVLVEDRSYSGSWLISSQADRNHSSRKALKEQYDQLLQGGVERLFYVDGESLLGSDRDDTTDGSHPSDLGFFRHAEALEPVLRKALG
ncbi:MAG UNVERIFIED_CONTAM: SGNH/GDSL hydrolase family protein [Planctomycetaceae bacterium]|jgi:lysophospholipase L1-like esterase